MAIRSVLTKLVMVCLIASSVPAWLWAQTPARVRVTRDRATVWRPGFLVPLFAARVDQEFEVLSRQGGWYEVVVPATASVPRQTGFVNVNDARVISGTPRVSPVTPRGATSAPASAWRGFVAIDGGMRLTSSSMTTSWTETVSLETASYRAESTVKGAPVFGGGVAVRLVSNLAAYVTVSRFAASNPAALDISVPHPFAFNSPRTATGESSPLSRSELDVSFDALWLARVHPKWQVALFGGATLFHASQDVVAKVNYSDPYPHDAITIVGTPTDRLMASPVGVNAGVDVIYRLNRRIGVAGGVHYSHASTDFVRSDGTATPATLGGVDVTGGLRVRF